MGQLDFDLAVEGTLEVAELTGRIRGVIDDAFPAPVWVRGQIKGLRRVDQRGHQYFDLVDRRAGPERNNGIIPVSLFNQARQRVERVLRTSHGLHLEDGLEVRIQAEVDYYPPMGRLSLRMLAIDPAYTLGRMLAERDRLIRALDAEGLLERNKQLPVPLVPLRVGLVASAGTAGYHDFCQHLHDSGLGFRVVHADARVSGPSAPTSIVRALKHVLEARVDLVVLLRGGGGRTDLAVFDAERIARQIVAMPVPVITGIGHEIDSSVADLVAHTALKTPTAVASWLIDRTRAFLTQIDDTWSRLARRADAHCRAAEARLANMAALLDRDVRRQLTASTTRLDRAADRLRGAPRTLTLLESRLATLGARVGALDPAVTLARGWSITRRADGTLVRSIADVHAGDVLSTTVADGSVTSTVDGAIDPETGREP